MSSSRASSGWQRTPDFCELVGLTWMNILADLQFPQELSCTCWCLLEEVEMDTYSRIKGWAPHFQPLQSVVWWVKQNKTCSYIKIWHSRCHLLQWVGYFICCVWCTTSYQAVFLVGLCVVLLHGSVQSNISGRWALNIQIRCYICSGVHVKGNVIYRVKWFTEKALWCSQQPQWWCHRCRLKQLLKLWVYRCYLEKKLRQKRLRRHLIWKWRKHKEIAL